MHQPSTSYFRLASPGNANLVIMLQGISFMARGYDGIYNKSFRSCDIWLMLTQFFLFLHAGINRCGNDISEDVIHDFQQNFCIIRSYIFIACESIFSYTYDLYSNFKRYELILFKSRALDRFISIVPQYFLLWKKIYIFISSYLLFARVVFDSVLTYKIKPLSQTPCQSTE